ncbi:ankyrin repeat-containing protein [Fusarium pseudocircinatum]|uniref:Ankyrin repeat-containing protein n=1 Tax=Fusarium pseudocircinatum TaxID=56676 RepID=A0A8H5KTE2_9HYPO|nr:ankyrin repeat-containing protein [Fusarium pseudocircinatum]
MSFGFGVGDIIKVVELCHKLRRDFADAPRQWQEIHNEMRSLSIVLGDIDVCVSNDDLTDKDRKDLLETARECRNILDELSDTAIANRVLDIQNSVGTGNRTKRVWKRLKWDPDHIRDIRGRISSNVSLLNAFLHRMARTNTAKLVQYVEDQELRRALEWLCPVDYGVQQSDLIMRRQPDTAKWFLNSPEFRRWLEIPGASMFCPGIPGAGKTIMTAVVVDHLLSSPVFGEGVGIAYIYFNFRRGEEQTLNHLIASLLRQLAQQHCCAAEKVKDLYNTHTPGNTQATSSELLNLLYSITMSTWFSRIFVIVDALDECQSSGNVRAKFLSEMLRLQEKVRINIFATSRFITEIERLFIENGAVTVEIRASNEDIQAYMGTILDTLPACVRRSSQLQDEIKETILRAVDGMFLLAQIYASSLEDKLTPKAVRATLNYFRQQGIRSDTGEDAMIQALSQAYDQLMERIHSQRQGYKELAQKTLLWIVHACKPLTTFQLSHTLAFDGVRFVYDEDNIPELQDIISVCNGLVVVDKEGDIIRLVHYTAQQYFEHKRECWFPDADWIITSTCLAILTTTEWFPPSLQVYAAEHWARHLSRCPPSAQRRRQVIQFLQQDNLTPAWAKSMTWDLIEVLDFPWQAGNRVQLNGLHLTAHFGLTVAMDELLADETHLISPDVRDSGHRTPLCYAARSGNVDAVRLLIRRGSNVNVETPAGQTPLTIATTHGHEKIAQILIDKGANVDQTSLYFAVGLFGSMLRTTALCIAAVEGHADMVRLLLAHGADIEFENKKGEMAIFLASSSGHADVMQLLIENGADIESADKTMTTPLMQACRNGHLRAVKLLLRHEAGLERINNDGKTAMSVAASSGSEPILIALMEAGARIDHEDFLDQTPLLLAAIEGHANLVELLLSKGANVEAYRKFIHRKAFFREPRISDLTPLLAAAYYGHACVVATLLNYNADMEARDAEGETPLTMAASETRYNVVELLVKRGADIQARNRRASGLRDFNRIKDQFHQDPEGYVESVAFTLNSMRIVSTGRGMNDIKVWNIATGQYLWKHEGHIKGIATLTSNNGKQLALGSYNCTVKLLDAEITPPPQNDPVDLRKRLNQALQERAKLTLDFMEANNETLQPRDDRPLHIVSPTLCNHFRITTTAFIGLPLQIPPSSLPSLEDVPKCAKTVFPNGPESVAGVLIEDYHQRYRTGERFRLLLCDNLNAKLLVTLCARSYVVDDSTPGNFSSDPRFDGIFTDMGLAANHKHGSENVLCGKLVSEARWLLRKAYSWGPFIPIMINGTQRYMWNTKAVMAILACFENAMDWMQGNRMSDKEERAGQSDGHAARTTQEISMEERLALLSLSQLALSSEILCNNPASESGKYPPRPAMGIT